MSRSNAKLGMLRTVDTCCSVRCARISIHYHSLTHVLSADIVDYYEPVMLIVGSRGLGNLKGCVPNPPLFAPAHPPLYSILLGSTSHYLIQKCSVPVMVARRRLKRPPRRAAHLKANRVHVKLAEAAVDRVASKVDQDVAKMRSEIARDDERRSDGHRNAEDEDDVDTEVEGDAGPSGGIGEGTENSLGEKVAGNAP